jgi:hypothetical protein
MLYTTLVLTCGIDGCTSLVSAEWEPGEPMTRNYPGYPGCWYPFNHRIEEPDDNHINRLEDDFNTRCDQIAAQSFDNDIWDY